MADYYVDPSIGTDTGAGTVGDPWGSTGNHIQRAMDLITPATDGDTIHVKDTGTVDFGGTDLDFTSYGATSWSKTLCVSGYTSAAWDGGRATINLNGASTFAATTVIGLMLRDLDISGGTGTFQVSLSQYTIIYRCKINGGGATGGIKVEAYSCVADNYVYNLGGDGIGAATGGGVAIMNNYVVQASNNAAITCGPYATISGNIAVISNTGGSARGIATTSTSYAVRIINNTIYSSVAATASGIYFGSTNSGVNVVRNNYVEGFSGTGGIGYDLSLAVTFAIYQGNRWYNCSTGEDLTGATVFVDEDNSATTASGLTNAGSGDYTPTSELQAGAWPPDFLGLSGNAQAIDIGAIQLAWPTGGGGGSGGGSYVFM